MTLPASPNAISFSQVNVELNLPSTATISLNDSAVRTLAGVGGSGTIISMSNLHGKSNLFTATLPAISANTSNYNIRSAAITAGWNQVSPVSLTVTINSGFRVFSTSTGTAALTTGSFPSGSTLVVINNGTIVGMGGAGGAGGATGSGTVGGAGGAAVTMNYPLTITNNGTVYGGGGGGGGGSATYFVTPVSPAYGGPTTTYIAGGGGGGGQGLNGGPGGAGGSAPPYSGSAGTAGSFTARGLGGSGGFYAQPESASIDGGSGGNGGLFGAAGASSDIITPLVAGGAGGNAVTKNGNVLTWGGTNGSSATYVKGSVV